MKPQLKSGSLLVMLALTVSFFSCKKEKDAHVPPDVVFKTSAGYTSADATVGQGDTLLVGIVATKTEDDLKSFNVSYAYDGASSTTTFHNYFMTSSEYEGYSADTEIITRNQVGTEKWVFSIVDRDGNITQKTLILTVQ
ncbi:MAG: hypothetical protein KDD36_01090 [Flavobacteriales bacterium]|nr:hypothetical protein [Flavobacteriales bacterium]